MNLLASALAWMPLLHPIALPTSARLWMFPPLALCIAIVYRATRARAQDQLFRGSLITFVNIVIGMWLIALAAYLVHAIALWLS